MPINPLIFIWISFSIKGDSNPNDKYVLSERAIWYKYYQKRLKIGAVMGIYLLNSMWPTFSRHFEYLSSFQIF